MKITIERLAEVFRLRVSLDECNDKIIHGKQGDLYFAGGDLCLMVIDGAPLHRRLWAALGGRLWIGETSLGKNGRRVQDVKIEGIPIENARAAIKLLRIRPKRVLSAEQSEGLLARLPKAS
jgi:hypothetical protein